MKKIRVLIVTLVSLFAFNINTKAASGNLSVSASNVYVGDSFTVSVNVNSTAAWNVHVTSSGPVSGCSINQADATADALDTSKTFSATCTATGEGTITITLSGDVTSADDGIAVSLSGTKTVSVSSKPSPTPTPEQTPTSTSSNNSDTITTNNSNTEENKKSNNNKLKEIGIEGYNLVKVDDRNYTLTVPNSVSSIRVNAKVDDAKATLTGTGNHDIRDGENIIEVIVTAEDGSKNKIKLTVTKKSKNTIDDLESVLKEDKNLNINIESNTKLSKEEVEQIKNSNKTVSLNYYDNDEKLVYSWIIDGSKLENSNELDTAISFNSDNKKEILKESNYSDGMYIHLKQNNVLNATKIKLYVGNKYENKDVVNIYGYDNKKLNLVAKNLVVKDGYIEFEPSNANDFLITMATLYSSNNTITATGINDNKSFIIIILLIILVVILNAIFIIRTIRKNKINNKNANLSSDETIITPENADINTNINSTATNDMDTNFNEESIFENNIQDSNINELSNEDNSYTNIFTNNQNQ